MKIISIKMLVGNVEFHLYILILLSIKLVLEIIISSHIKAIFKLSIYHSFLLFKI
jgi:hypothetical protein